MTALRAIYHLARADFRERIRRYSFLVVVGLTIAVGTLLVPPTEADYVAGILPYDVETPGDSFRGVNNSAWVGGMVALLTTLLLSLPAFYVVKGAVERDRRTGVGEILATTPMTRFLYALGKWLSNAAVLAVMVGILAVAALVMQIIRGEELHVDLWALSSPFLFITLPVGTLVAATAVLFEMAPGLRSSMGNMV
jgi:ABC-type Na+ efflux pump permease subunit